MMTEDKRIVILGASSGIGREMTLEFIRLGYRVGIAARRTEMLMEIKNMAPEQVCIRQIDITAADAAAQLAALVEELGGMDIYLHVAGVGKQNRELDSIIEQETFQINVTGFANAIRWAYHYFACREYGQIAAVSSIAGTKGLGVAAAYSASKRFQNSYLQALAQLAGMEGHRIFFTDIRPGFVDTALLSGTQRYPMMMDPRNVARHAVKAILRKRRVAVIDWRYALITFFWRLIPDSLWIRMAIRTRKKKNASD